MKRVSFLVLLIAYLAFISLGLPDGLLGVGWPSISSTFGRSLGDLGFLLIGLSIGYLFSSFNSGTLIERFGVGGLLLISSLCVAGGLFGYALAPTWWMLIAVSILLGAGGGAIDASLNTYAAANFSERHINWLHACYGMGVMIGPLVMVPLLDGGEGWRRGYALVGGAISLLALVFAATRRLWQAPAPANQPDGQPRASLLTALRSPAAWLGMALFFAQTGTEVTAGQWAYTLLTEGRGISIELAGLAVSLYWGSLMVGRIVFGFVVTRFDGRATLRVAMLLLLLGGLLFWWNPLPLIGIAGLALMGFMVAPVFPLLMAHTPARAGAALTAHIIGLQIAAANIAASLVPALGGVLVEWLSLEVIGPYVLLVALALFGLHELALAGERTGRAEAVPARSPQA